MKQSTLFTVALLCVIIVFHMATGQVMKKEVIQDSRYLQYEGVLTDPSGERVTGEYTATFTIFDSPDAEVPRWVEVHDISVNEGEFKVTLGKNTPLPSLDSEDTYIGVSIAGEELLPRQVVRSSRPQGEESMRDFPKSREPFFLRDDDWNYWDNPPHMFVIPQGNIGIGTSEPNTRLNVFCQDGDGILLNDAASGSPRGSLWNAESGGVLNLNDASEAITVKIRGYNIDGVQAYFTAGKVGIGTSHPLSKLTVREEGANELQFPLRLTNPDYTNEGGTATGILFETEGGDFGKGALVYERKGGWGMGDFHFLQSTNPDESIPTLNEAVVTIKNNGSVGIGTSEPNTRLNVFCQDGDGILLNDAASGSPRVSLWNAESGGVLNLSDASEAITVKIRGYDANGVGAYFNSGKVGIGTTSPDAELDVNGTAQMTGIKLTTGAAKGYVLTSDALGVGTWRPVSGGGLPPGTSGQTLRHDGSDWIANSLLFNNGTSVGIGTESPAAKFDVQGSNYDLPVMMVTNTDGRNALTAESYGASNYSISGMTGFAENTGTGSVYGGEFSTSAEEGPEWAIHKGLYAIGRGSHYIVYGVHGHGKSDGDGIVYGGYFDTYYDGVGKKYGVYASAESWFGSNPVRGIHGGAFNIGNGETYGGDFAAYSEVPSNVSYGIHSYSSNLGAGDCYGGYFKTNVYGTGVHYGIKAEGYGAGSSETYGTYGYAINSDVGPAFGGYFLADPSGTGTHYGVYSYEAEGGSGAAIYASGDMIASGAKPAVVKTSSGHRLLYAQESPEVWFEDFGEGQLVNGRAHVDLDPLFLETVTINGQHPMKVFVQLTSGEPMPVVVEKGSTGFDVKVHDRASVATFDFRVVAKRKGYETERLRETDVGYDDPNLYPEFLAKIEKKYEEERQKQDLASEERKQEREQMEKIRQMESEMKRERR